MYNNINQFVKKVYKDPLSAYLEHVSFTINGFGRFSQQSISSYQQFFSDDLELILFAQGRSILSTEDRQYELVPGSLALLTPFHTYTAVCQPGEQVYYYYIHFSISPFHMTDSYLQAIIGGEGPLVVPPGELPDFRSNFLSMLQDWREEAPGLMTLLESQLYALSVLLARRNDQGPLSALNENQKVNYELEQIAAATDYITAHLDSPIKLYDLSRELGISSSALYKLFRQFLHTNPSDYITRTRLRQAELLMRSSGCTIAEAAQRYGFCNASHMSRQFKKVYGMAPSQLLKENLRDKELVEDQPAGSLPPKKDSPPLKRGK